MVTFTAQWEKCLEKIKIISKIEKIFLKIRNVLLKLDDLTFFVIFPSAVQILADSLVDNTYAHKT